jgi:hypothetical protein
MKNAVGDKKCTAVVAVSEILTQLISNAFSLSFYTFFSYPDPSLKPYGYYTCLIMMHHVSSSPNLSPCCMARFTLRSPWPSSVKEMQTGLSFFRLTLLGMGLQKPISKWIKNGWALRLLYLLDNDSTRPILTQPLHHRIDSFTRYVPRHLQAWRTNKLAGPYVDWTLQW